MNGVPGPDLSVVVPSVNGWTDLEGTLAALYAQQGGVKLEVLIVERVGKSVRDAVRRSFPSATVIDVSIQTTIPQMRAIAFDAARAEIVGVIEDHVIVPTDWAARMLEAHAAGAQVVGGAVDNAATGTIVDWAAFLCEYSHCLVPPACGPATWVTGNNVTYRKALLLRFHDLLCEGYWEDTLHDAIRAGGVTLYSRPDIRVGHNKHYSAAEYTSQRYFYSRAFAAMRVRDFSLSTRLLYGFMAPALPPLIFWRVVSRVLNSGRHRIELLQSLPLLGVFAISWAFGELMGYWYGDGGALAKVC